VCVIKVRLQGNQSQLSVEDGSRVVAECAVCAWGCQ
jgi:hypothetical protein